MTGKDYILSVNICYSINISYLSHLLFSIIMKIYTETPSQSTKKIFIDNRSVTERDPAEIKIIWDPYNLTSNHAAVVQISLWGYGETTKPDFEYINVIEVLTFIYIYTLLISFYLSLFYTSIVLRKELPTLVSSQ